MTEHPRTRSRFTRPLQALAASVGLFLLSIGLCNAGHFNIEGQPGTLANAGVWAFFGSVILFFVSLLWILVAAAIPSKDGPPPSIK